MNNKLSIAIALLLIFTLLEFVPNVSAASVGILETFQEYDIGTRPCLPTPVYTAPCNGLDGNRYSEVGSSFSSTVDTGPSGHDYAFQPTVANNGAQGQFDTHHNLCENPTGDGFVISIGSNGANPQHGTLLQLMGKVPGNPLVVSQRIYSVFFDFPSPSPTFGRATLSVQNYVNNVLTTSATTTGIVYTTTGFAANQLYTFKILCPSTSASGTMRITSLDSGATASVTVPINAGANYVNDNIWAANAGDDIAKPVQLYDDITYHYSIPGISPVATSATYASGIAGFDITKDGTAVIIRTNNPSTGQDVRILNGDSLIESANTPIATQCNRLHGVVGLADDGFGYIHCDGSSVPDKMNFVSATGTTYAVSNCDREGTGFIPPNDDQVCDGSFDITPISSRASLYDVVATLPGISTYNAGTTSGNVIGNYYSLLFAESSTYLAATLNYRYVVFTGGGTTNSEEVNSVQINDLSNFDICSFGNLKAFRTSPGNPVMEIDVTNNIVSPGGHIVPSTNQVTGFGTGALADGSYIDCANNMFIVNDATNLKIYNPTDNIVILNKTIVGGSYNTISDNGTYAAYSDGTLTHVINGLTGIELASITNPGLLFDMEMDQCAQKLFLATTTTPKVYEYNIVPYTTVTPVKVGNGTCIVSSGIGSSSSETTTNIPVPTPTEPSLTGVCSGSYVCRGNGEDNHFWFGLDKSQMASDFNITEGKFNWLLTLLVIIVVTLVVFLFITKSPLVLSLVVLATLGLCVALGTVPIWFLLTMIFIIIVVSVRTFLGGGGEE